MVVHHRLHVSTVLLSVFGFIWSTSAYAQRGPILGDGQPVQGLEARADVGLVIYPSPGGAVRPSEAYEVTVLQRAQSKSVFVYQVTAPQESPAKKNDGAELYRKRGVNYSFATFSYQGVVTVRIKKRLGIFKHAVIRPARL